MSKLDKFKSKEAQQVAHTTEELRILNDAITELEKTIKKKSGVEKNVLKQKKAELEVQKALNKAKQNRALTKFKDKYGDMSAKDVTTSVTKLEVSNEKASQTSKYIRYTGDALSNLIQAVVTLKTNSYEQEYERVSAETDILMTEIDALGKKAVGAAQLSAKAYTAAIDSSLSNLIDGVNEGAYAAASNMIDISAQSKIFALEQKQIDLQKKNAVDLRTAQKTANLNNLEAQRTEAVTKSITSGARIAARAGNGFWGETGSAIAEGAAGVADGIAAGNAAITAAEGKAAVQNVENQKKVTEAQLDAAINVEKTWIEGGAHVAKAWLNFAQQIENGLVKSEAAANDMGVGFGLSGKQLESFKRSMFDSQVAVSKWGKNMEDMQKLQNNYAETTGRNIQFSTNDFDTSFALDKLAGEDGLSAQMASSMEIFNHSVADSNEMFGEMYKSASKIGLNGRKFLKDLSKNLTLAEKFQFKGGMKSLMEMSKWAQNMRFNMGSLDSMLSKVQDGGLEGVIEQAAKLQVLGGAYAMGSDPLAMGFESYMDPEGFAKRMNGMLKGEGVLNSRTGEVEFGIASQMRMKAMADATGQDIKDVRKQAIQMVKGETVNSKLNSGINWSEDDKALITNKAQLVDGEWKVMTDENKYKAVADLNLEDLKHLKPTDNEEKLVNYVSDIRDMMTQLEGVKQYSKATLERDGYEQWYKEEITRMKQVMGDFDTNYETVYLAKFKKNMEKATEAQDTMLKLMGVGHENIEGATGQILAEGRNIANTLSNANTIIDNALQEIKNAKAPESETIKELDEAKSKTQRRWDKLQEERSRDEGYFGNFSKGQAIATARAKYYSARGDEKWANGNYFGWGVDKISALGEQIFGRAAQGIANLFGIDATTLDNWLNDGLVSANGQSMAVSASKVTPIHDGEVARTDAKDHGLFAKTGGPFDTLFNGIFAKINEISKVMPTATLDVAKIGGIIDKVFNQITPRPMPYNTFVKETPYSNKGTADNGTIGKIEISPIQINGTFQINTSNGSIDISDKLANNSDFIRTLSKLISVEVEKKVQGGRVVNPLNRGLVW